jgi:transcription initiation factor IIE alpha subunit
MYKMLVLLLFDKLSEWTLEKIYNQTQIKIELVIDILNSLLKSKLLIYSKLIDEDLKEKDLHMNYTIELANHFQRY